MQKDFQVLIEQKAGKRDEYHRRHKEDHFIQMMLYQGVLMYNFGQETANMQTFLLYSKYADGLLIEHLPKFVPGEHQAPKLHRTQRDATGRWSHRRNCRLTEHRFAERIADWRKAVERLPGTATADGHQYAETLYTAGAGLLQPFFTFVSKEQILSKTGGSNDASHGLPATGIFLCTRNWKRAIS